jgi:hypothetical protein
VPVGDHGPADGEHTDENLIAVADHMESGFITIWLQPA